MSRTVESVSFAISSYERIAILLVSVFNTSVKLKKEKVYKVGAVPAKIKGIHDFRIRRIFRPHNLEMPS